MSALHFEKVRYKNILSTGNQWTEIVLDANKSTLIIGENGAGKSTMLDAISFGLYGKPFRKINKPQLVNSINEKGLEVEVYFRTGGNSYKIVRGIKPGIFEIWRGSELVNQDAAARDYQSYLEENILKLNFKSFGQIVVLGSSTFAPFMQLPTGQRREVIEDLLDIQIFTSMNYLLKERVNTNKDALKDLKYHVDLLTNKIKDAKDHNESIRTMKKDEVAKIRVKVADLLKYIESEKVNINTNEEEMRELLHQISDKSKVEERLNQYQDLMRRMDTKNSRLNKDNSFFSEHSDCPTCRQDIDDEFKQNIILKNTNELKELEAGIRQGDEKINDLRERLSEIADIGKLVIEKNLTIQEHRANINLTKNTLDSIKKDLEDAEAEVETIDQSKIEGLKLELKDYRVRGEELVNEREVLSVVSVMLKDGGIKTRIIKQYVPVMNKLINKYLASMDFFVDFRLDESFNETIKSRFRDIFSYASFSEGEKLRIDLALLFTWRAVSKLRNSVSTNLLVMDEIMDSSLDNAGTEEFLKIINELTEDSNIFIISHKGDQLYDKFEHTIKFKKTKNFSMMET